MLKKLCVFLSSKLKNFVASIHLLPLFHFFSIGSILNVTYWPCVWWEWLFAVRVVHVWKTSQTTDGRKGERRVGEALHIVTGGQRDPRRRLKWKYNERRRTDGKFDIKKSVDSCVCVCLGVSVWQTHAWLSYVWVLGICWGWGIEVSSSSSPP